MGLPLGELVLDVFAAIRDRLDPAVRFFDHENPDSIPTSTEDATGSRSKAATRMAVFMPRVS